MKNLIKYILTTLLSGTLFFASAQSFDLLSVGTKNKVAQTPKFTVSNGVINIYSSTSFTQPTSTINGDTMLVARVQQSTTSVNNPTAVVNNFSLDQNYPNPFNMSTVIRFSLPEQSNVTIKVFDLTGREIATVVNESKSQGIHSVGFGNNQLSTGTYIYRMIAHTASGKTNVETKKMIVMK